MKNNNGIIILFHLFFIHSIFGQDVTRGKVIDSETNAPLSLTQIISKNKIIFTTQASGAFTLNDIGTYTFKKEGYEDIRLTIKSHKTLIVQITPKPIGLNEVIVNTNQIPKVLKLATSTTNILSKKDIDRSNNTNTAQILNRVPGVFVQSGALNTNRLTIRGVGSRNLFGTSNIRAYFNDIPLTNGSGETTIEDFELAAISRINVIKGAVSSIYGTGLGGTIHLRSQNSYLNSTTINNELTIGSFGLKKATINFNHGTNKNSYRGIYSNTTVDGFRDNNEYNRQTLTLNTNHFINERNELSVLASYVNLKAFIPSSLNEDAFRNNPSAAAFTWSRAKGFEDSKRGILGVTWNNNFNPKVKHVTSVFSSFRSSYEPRPFNILSEDTFAYGIRSRILGHLNVLKKSLTYTIGGEYFKDNYKSETFQNLYEDFPEANGSVEGNQLSNFKEDRNYYNIFFEANYELNNKLIIVAGINYNKTSYKLEDKFPISETNPDQSGDFSFASILSPKLGVSYLLSKRITLYSNIGQGFSPISLAETLLPDGQINSELKPEVGWNYEIGARGQLLKNKLQFNMALYRLDIRNLVVSRRVQEDQFIGINAGKTRHDGIELDLNYNFITTESLNLNTKINYTLNNFKFKKFIDGENDFSGNDLTGVPSNIFNFIVDASSKFGLYGNINYQYVGSQPITDSNNLYSRSNSLTNLKIGFQKSLLKGLNLNIFVGIDNIFDKNYASQILINASAFGGNAPRYFYPGNPINYFTGLNINYAL